MKRSTCLSVSAFILLTLFNGILFSQPGTRESFNENWKFTKYFNTADENITTDKEPTGLQAPSVNDNAWRTLNLPHDWAIECPFSDTLENNTGLLPWKGISWHQEAHLLQSQSCNSYDSGQGIS